MSVAKRYITFVLVGLFLFALVGPVYTVIHFYVNQVEITETLCENIDKPELNCNGHCYLKKQLTNQNEVNQEQENSENRLTVIWPNAFQALDEISIESNENQILNNSQYNNHYQFIGPHDLLDPPQV